MFNEICIYEAKLTKLDEIEELMKEVAEFYLQQDGVIDVHYIKRTHRQKDFNAVKEGELPVRLTRNVGKVDVYKRQDESAKNGKRDGITTCPHKVSPSRTPCEAACGAIRMPPPKAAAPNADNRICSVFSRFFFIVLPP